MQAISFWQRVVDVCVYVTVPFLLGSIGYFAPMIIDHEVRIKVLESNTYTQADALEDAKESRIETEKKYERLLKAISEIREAIARIEGSK